MIERTYPGVYVTEIPLRAEPVDGVPTREAAPVSASQVAHTQDKATPTWTQHNDSDPGITLLQLFAFLAESPLFGPVASGPSAARVHVQPGYGVLHGLAVDTHTECTPQLKVSPGQALGTDGTTLGPETRAHRIRKP